MFVLTKFLFYSSVMWAMVSIAVSRMTLRVEEVRAKGQHSQHPMGVHMLESDGGAASHTSLRAVATSAW